MSVSVKALIASGSVIAAQYASVPASNAWTKIATSGRKRKNPRKSSARTVSAMRTISGSRATIVAWRVSDSWVGKTATAVGSDITLHRRGASARPAMERIDEDQQRQRHRKHDGRNRGC